MANWFQEVGPLNLSEEMKYPKGRYHIRCTLEEISENDEAMELVTKAMKLITGMTLAKGEGMWDMMKKMKLESMKAVSYTHLDVYKRQVFRSFPVSLSVM